MRAYEAAFDKRTLGLKNEIKFAEKDTQLLLIVWQLYFRLLYTTHIMTYTESLLSGR